MILTEEKTYIINVTEVDTDAELGLNKKDIMIEYTNLELLHAVLASTMPYGRLLTGSLQKQWVLEQQQREQIIQLSHELKTPLAVIEGNADLLAEDEALTPEQREQVEAILRGTEQTRTYLLKIRAQVQTPLKYKRP